jgi:oligopeptide transport system substrate-binding protein
VIRFANGREVEAEDYIFALERALDPKTGSGGQSVFFGIRGAEDFSQGKAAHVAGLRAPDHRTLVIELSEPSFVFPFKLAWPVTFPVPREIVNRSQRDFRNTSTVRVRTF